MQALRAGNRSANLKAGRPRRSVCQRVRSQDRRTQTDVQRI